MGCPARVLRVWGNNQRANKHNRRLRFLLRSEAGKDTEGHLKRRNDQRPRRLQEEEEWEWE